MTLDSQLLVLVIEDDPDTRANICDILELNGFRAITASSFGEALARDNWDEIGAILTDRRLPDGVAEDMLPRLKSLAPDIPVVVVTGFPDVEGPIAALRGGAYDYILKPINPDVLLASLGRITELRQIEHALRDRECRLQAILETASDAILTFDSEGVIQSVNPATERMFGYPADEIVGHTVQHLLPHRWGEAGRGVGYILLQSGILGSNPMFTARRKDGSTLPIELAISQIDHLEFYTAIIRDVSQCRELQREVLEIAAEEDRRIGHELHDNIQQQLTGLSLLARSLADSLADKKLPEAPRAQRLADELSATGKQVHLLARGLIPVEVDAQGLRAALTLLAHRISELHRVRCEFRHEGSIAVEDNFVATHLFRVAQEAINNAIKHSRAKRIVVSLTGSDGNIVLEVADDGVGIAENSEFQPGMGLRIMSYRAGLIGASLDVKRRECGGTAIVCAIWRATAPPPVPLLASVPDGVSH